MSLSLIARADDAGVNMSTTQAILATAQAGFIRNVGVMIPPASEEAALAPLRELPPGTALGLHATITSEWDGQRWGPVLGAAVVPSLVGEDGTFHRSCQLVQEQARPEEVEREVCAQLDRMRQWGFEPVYLDAHMVWTWIPELGERMARLCEREGLVFGNDQERFPTLPVLADPVPENPTERLLARLKGAEVPLGLLLFHPCEAGDDTQGMYKGDPETWRGTVAKRAEETAILTDPAFIQQVAQAGVRSVTYPEAAAGSFSSNDSSGQS